MITSVSAVINSLVAHNFRHWTAFFFLLRIKRGRTITNSSLTECAYIHSAASRLLVADKNLWEAKRSQHNNLIQTTTTFVCDIKVVNSKSSPGGIMFNFSFFWRFWCGKFHRIVCRVIIFILSEFVFSLISYVSNMFMPLRNVFLVRCMWYMLLPLQFNVLKWPRRILHVYYCWFWVQ